MSLRYDWPPERGTSVGPAIPAPAASAILHPAIISRRGSCDVSKITFRTITERGATVRTANYISVHIGMAPLSQEDVVHDHVELRGS